MSTGHIGVQGVRLHYRLDGPEGAPVLMLANSLGTTLDMWSPQLGDLIGRFRVLRYDIRGHGASDTPIDAYKIDDLGRDALALLDALQIDSVHFCGLSLGGIVGQWLGRHAPARIERLVLANTAAHLPPPDKWNALMKLAKEKGMPAVVPVLLDRWLTRGFRLEAPREESRIGDMILAASPLGFAGCCAALRDVDLRSELKRIEVPTLVIAGSADAAVPVEDMRALAEAIPAAQLRLLDEAPHFANIERPAAFTEALLRFLAPA